VKSTCGGIETKTYRNFDFTGINGLAKILRVLTINGAT
jgi:hypothetical protein